MEKNGSFLFFAYSGEFILQGERKVTRTIGPGGVFGEVALLTAQPRQADCIATTAVKVRKNRIISS